MRVGLLGVGAIGEFVLEATSKGQAGAAKIVVVAGRGSQPQAVAQIRRAVRRCARSRHLRLRVIVEGGGHAGLSNTASHTQSRRDLVVLSAGRSRLRPLASLIAACREPAHACTYPAASPA